MSHTTYSTLTHTTSAGRDAHTRIILPYLSERAGQAERDIYMAFLHAFRDGANRRMEVRLLTAIHRAADVTENSDAYVSRVLADMGLLAPRLAFPGDFLDHVEATLQRDRPLMGMPASYEALLRHWVAIGDDALPAQGTGARNIASLHSFLAPA